MGMSMNISLAVAKAMCGFVILLLILLSATWIYRHVLPCPADLGSRAFKIDGCGHKRLGQELDTYL